MTVESVDSVQETILSDRLIGLQRIAEIVGISVKRGNHIVHKELGMRKLCVKWVPKELNGERAILACFERDSCDVLGCLVTVDERSSTTTIQKPNSSHCSGDTRVHQGTRDCVLGCGRNQLRHRIHSQCQLVLRCFE